MITIVVISRKGFKTLLFVTYLSWAIFMVCFIRGLMSTNRFKRQAIKRLNSNYIQDISGDVAYSGISGQPHTILYPGMSCTLKRFTSLVLYTLASCTPSPSGLHVFLEICDYVRFISYPTFYTLSFKIVFFQDSI